MLTKKNDCYTLSFIMDDNNKEIINFKNIDEIDSICDINYVILINVNEKK